MVYIAKESIYTFDAHYGQRVFCFDAAYINPETVTWYVSTPFGKEGVPNKIGDTEIASGMDYKWVKFKINRDTDVIIPNNGGGSYTSIKHNRWYPGDDSPELMDILKFTQYIKAQKRLLDATLYNINLDYTSIDNVNIIRDILRESNIDFVLEEDEEWKNAFPNRPDLYYRFRIYVTTYVDEYYYKVDPISNLASVDLWKRFVNKPNRLMHILCDDRVSLDKASSATGSVITIRQRSIQTPFNINKPTLTTGWGCETIDELEESRCFFFSPNEYYNSSGNISGTPTIPTGNNSPYNGLYNTAVLLGMVNNNNYVNNIKWSTFLDFNQLNDQTYGDGTTYNQMAHFIKEDKLALLYGTLMRNRDNNGNGIIDPDELKWYVGALNQYVGLYIGGEGLTQNAWLYAPRYSTQPNERLNDGSKFNDAYKWRVRVISSTNNTMLWGEEGISTSSYGANFGKPAMVLIKSLRNLGIDNITASQLANKESAETKYDFLINVTKPTDETDINAVYSFDLTNVNESSLRFFTTRELEPYTENTEMARCYSKFETGPLVTLAEAGYRRGDYDGYIDLKNDLLAGNSPCPKGYRVANIREGALMSVNCTNAAWWNNDKYSVVTSEFSLRSYESHNGCISWEVKNNHITLNGVADDGKHIRCVRDIR